MSWWIVAPEIYHLYLHISTFFGCFFVCWWTLKDENSPWETDVFFFLRCALHQLGEDGKVGITQCHRLLIKGSEAGKRTKRNKTQAFCFVLGDNTDTYNFLDFFSVELIVNGKTSIHSSNTWRQILGEVLQPRCSPTKIQKNQHTPHGQKTKKSCSPRKLSWHGHIHKLKEGKDFFLTNFYPAFATTLSWCRLEGWTWTCQTWCDWPLVGHHFFLGVGRGKMLDQRFQMLKCLGF